MTTEQNPIDARRPDVEAMVIAWRQAREDRLAADKVAAALKEREVGMKDWLIAVYREQRLEGSVVNGRFTGLRVVEQPSCPDREALTAYILETRQLELLEFRLAKRALAERRDQGVEIPGLLWIDTYELSDRKI
jgi:hypothetical protein